MNPLRLVLIGVILCAAVGFGYIGYIASLPRPLEPAAVVSSPPPRVVSMLVASRELPAGTLLKDEDFVGKQIAVDDMPDGALVLDSETKAMLRGAMLRQYIETSKVLTQADVLRPRERGFLAAVLRPNTRAISVGVDVISGASGLIWPGDQVDVILVQDLDPTKSNGADRRVVGETILNDVRVIAVDQQLTQGAPVGSTEGKVARTITLEVSAADAERVAVAQQMGRLALSVRAINTSIPETSRPPLFGSDISKAITRPTVASTRTMRVIQGADTQEVIFR